MKTTESGSFFDCMPPPFSCCHGDLPLIADEAADTVAAVTLERNMQVRRLWNLSLFSMICFKIVSKFPDASSLFNSVVFAPESVSRESFSDFSDRNE